MTQELRMGCARGAVDAFGMFFPNLGNREEHSFRHNIFCLLLF